MNTQPDIKDRSTFDSRSRRLASEFLARFRETGAYSRESINALCDLAVSDNPTTAKAAARTLFASIVEPLGDSFDPRAVSLYNRLFAQMIDCCRKTAAGRALDLELAAFQIFDERHIVARAEQLRAVTEFYTSAKRQNEIKRVIVLSRVTLGADVAVTSVIIERLKREFPQAEIILAGGRKASELFGGDARLQFKEVAYDRAGTLIERLLTWTQLVALARELTRKLKPYEYLIVDPDSRLTQLGLLPLDGNYLFFPSREYGCETQLSLGELTSGWLNEVFGGKEIILPRLNLNSEDRSAAAALINRMRKCRPRAIVALNFGVGENPLKRIDDEFEISLVANLIREGASVILDKGAGEDETRRADAIIAHIARLNREGRVRRAVELDETRLLDSLNADTLDAELLVWSGRIGMLAALISKSDLYIGYDSAGQHIAAASGVASINVFAGYSSARMLDRWRPTGPALSQVINVDTINEAADSRAVLGAAMSRAREMLRAVASGQSGNDE